MWGLKLGARDMSPDVRRGLKCCFIEVTLLREVSVVCVSRAPWDSKRCDAIGASIKRQVIIVEKLRVFAADTILTVM